MYLLKNPLRGAGLASTVGMAAGEISTAPTAVLRLLERCPKAKPTALRELPRMATACGVAKVLAKDESTRMGLGSFKALGAAYAIAKTAQERLGPDATEEAYRSALVGETFACSSAGNHGLSIAAGARVFGAKAVIYLSQSVPEAFAQRLRELGAEVVRAGEIYEESLVAAREAAEENGWTLLSDTSWLGYSALPRDIMEGYLAMAVEVAEALEAPSDRPSHIFLQAGVGGLAGALTAYFRRVWGNAPTIAVVEPEAAPALLESVRAGRPVVTEGPVSAMGRLDCKEPSHLALKCVAKDADLFVTVTEDEAARAVRVLGEQGIATTPSGGAGAAALLAAGTNRGDLGLTSSSKVLVIVSEGPE